MGAVLRGQRPAGRYGVSQVWLASVLFGTTGTAQALGPDGTTPLTVGAARLLVGGAALAAIALLVDRGGGPMRAVLCRPSAWVAAVGVASYQITFFAGTARAGVAVGTVVALGSAPVLTGAAASALDRVRPSTAWLASTAIAVAGLALLARGDGGSAADPVGVLAAVGAGASYAAYTVAGRRLLVDGHPPTTVMGATFGLGALLLVPVLLVGASGWLARPGGVVLALYLGLVPTATAYLLFARGLSVLPAATVATLTLAEPVVAATLGVAVLGERLGARGVTGLVLVGTALAGLAVAVARGRGQSPP